MGSRPGGKRFPDTDPTASVMMAGESHLTPSNANIGTRFLCFGSAVNFGSIEFEVQITEPAAYLVQDFRESLSADRVLVFIIFDVSLAAEEFSYDQLCIRGLLADLPDDQVSTVFDEGTDKAAVAGLAPWHPLTHRRRIRRSSCRSDAKGPPPPRRRRARLFALVQLEPTWVTQPAKMPSVPLKSTGSPCDTKPPSASDHIRSCVPSAR